MIYPRQGVLDNPYLKKLLVEKQELIEKGRSISQEIEAKEVELAKFDEEVQAIEKSIDFDELKKKSSEYNVQMAKLLEQIEKLKKDIYQKVQDTIPKKLKDAIEEVKKEKDKLENERNKIALKVQQRKDKIIPFAQKQAKQLLQDEFEDYDNLRLEGDELIITIFSHLEDFKQRFRTNKNK